MPDQIHITKNPARQRHHYIPQFYLKRWAGPDGKICEFSVPRGQIVKPRRTHPSGTGYVDNLYTLPGFPPETAQLIEKKFFGTTDQIASDALQLLLRGEISEIDEKLRSGWSRFILSLIHRTPEKIRCLKAEMKQSLDRLIEEVRGDWENFRLESDPPTFEEYYSQNSDGSDAKSFAMILQNIIDSPRVGEHLNNMRWSVLTVKTAHFRS